MREIMTIRTFWQEHAAPTTQRLSLADLLGFVTYDQHKLNGCIFSDDHDVEMSQKLRSAPAKCSRAKSGFQCSLVNVIKVKKWFISPLIS